MREIKFIVWDIDNKIMVDNALELKNDSIVKRVNLHERTSNNLIWRQFTGLKDKNGVDIYEGDICNLVINQNSPNYIGNQVKNLGYKTVVEYHHYASFVFKNLSEKKTNSYGFHSMNFGHSRMHTDLIEVIGNIHENPELLK